MKKPSKVCYLCWTTKLNPALSFDRVNLVENDSILKQFQIHGSSYCKYDLKISRSVPFLRTFLINILQRRGALKNVADVFNDIKVNKAARLESVINKITTNAKDTYTQLVYYKSEMLLLSYGIQVKEEELFETAKYNKIIRKPTIQRILTSEQKTILRKLIGKYEAVDKRSLKNLSTNYTLAYNSKTSNFYIENAANDPCYETHWYEVDDDEVNKEASNNFSENENYSAEMTANKQSRLYSYVINDGRVMLAFTVQHYLDHIISQLYKLLEGKGCTSWWRVFVEQEKDFEVTATEIIINSNTYYTGFHSKFLVLDKIKNAANKRNINSRVLIDNEKILINKATLSVWAISSQKM